MVSHSNESSPLERELERESGSLGQDRQVSSLITLHSHPTTSQTAVCPKQQYACI